MEWINLLIMGESQVIKNNPLGEALKIVDAVAKEGFIALKIQLKQVVTIQFKKRAGKFL